MKARSGLRFGPKHMIPVDSVCVCVCDWDFGPETDEINWQVSKKYFYFFTFLYLRLLCLWKVADLRRKLKV